MSRRISLASVVGGACERHERRLGLLGSLDTGRCSDMLESPENAENARVFDLSARWWMRPRRRRTGMQRTHLAGPSGIRTASDQFPSGAREVAYDSSRPLSRLLPIPRSEASGAKSFAVSRVAESVHCSRRSIFERLLLCNAPWIRAESGHGTSLANRITQMVPRMVTEPLKREGARR
jgi:hypothetical protein